MNEQIIPANTKRNRTRQYNTKKPKKWGFKTFVYAGQSGMIVRNDMQGKTVQIKLTVLQQM